MPPQLAIPDAAAASFAAMQGVAAMSESTSQALLQANALATSVSAAAAAAAEMLKKRQLSLMANARQD